MVDLRGLKFVIRAPTQGPMDEQFSKINFLTRIETFWPLEINFVSTFQETEFWTKGALLWFWPKFEKSYP